MGKMEFKGYMTQCGVKIKMLDGHPWAWEVDGEKTADSPLQSIASSTMNWYNGNELIFASCSVSCPYSPVYKSETYNLGDGERFNCYCELQHTREYDGSYREYVGEGHIKYRSWHFQRFLETGTMYCACVSEGNDGEPKIEYRADNCKIFHPHGCKAEICFITMKKRDLTVVNILADVKYKVDEGMLTEHEVIRKGIRLHDNMVKEIADRKIKEMLHDGEKYNIWEHMYGHKLNHQKPIRVYTAKGNGKDLLQDLADAREGLEVIHDSDLVKAAKAAKRERRTKAKEKKIQRLWRQYKNGDELARKLLIRKGLLDGEEPEGWMPEAETTKKPEAKQEFEQQSLF